MERVDRIELKNFSFLYRKTFNLAEGLLNWTKTKRHLKEYISKCSRYINYVGYVKCRNSQHIVCTFKYYFLYFVFLPEGTIIKIILDLLFRNSMLLLWISNKGSKNFIRISAEYKNCNIGLKYWFNILKNHKMNSRILIF